MVGVVGVTRFCEAGASKVTEYIKYIDRQEAVRKRNDDKFNIFDEYMEYMDDDAKVIVQEQKSLERISGLFTVGRDHLSAAEKREIKQSFLHAQSLGSNMWQTVISFDNRYLEQNGLYDSEHDLLNEKLLKQAARKGIGVMLHNEGMDHALWTAAIHYNTDNIHIHAAIVEPTPMREKKIYIRYRLDDHKKPVLDEHGHKIPVLDSAGNPMTYTAYKGRFKGKSLQLLKSSIRAELENNRDIYASITSLMRDTIIADKKSRCLLDTPEFTGKMAALYEELKQTGVSRRDWNYNQNLLRSCRPLINDLSRYFLDAYHRDDYENLIAEIDAEQRRQEKTYGGKSDYMQNVLYGKDGLYARLGNTILKELREYDRSLTEQSGKEKDNRISVRHSLNHDHGRALRRGLRLLEYNLQHSYGRVRNLREAELLQEEIAGRGNTKLEI